MIILSHVVYVLLCYVRTCNYAVYLRVSYREILFHMCNKKMQQYQLRCVACYKSLLHVSNLNSEGN